MVELTAKNIRNVVVLALLLGAGIGIGNGVVSEISWHLKYPNGWYDRAATSEKN